MSLSGRVEGTVAERPGAAAWLRLWVRELRLHQWVKNLLLPLPLLASHRIAEPELWRLSAWAFLSFSLCASAIYVMNDLADLAADRSHAARRARPFASGALPVAAGVAALPLLLAGAFGLAAWRLPPAFGAALGAYAFANVVYTFALKRVAVADVILLAAFYTLRVVAGGLAIGVPPSPWLLGFCGFFFLNLAFLKRYVELRRFAVPDGQVEGRGYEASDLALLSAMGPVAGYLAALVLALYIQAENVAQLYRVPALLWLETALCVYWVSRAWLLAHRGRLHDDPVAFALLDPVTWGVGAAGGLIAILAARF